MKTISIKEPTIWELTQQIESLKGMADDLMEIAEIHSKSLLDIGDAMENTGKMFLLHNKAIKELEKKCQKK